jgi:DNA-binding winged helix-turn-helix (wHTH) protein
VTYRFARFALNSDTRELFADGSEVRLSPKAFDLLLLLAQHRSRAVSKTELQERLWPSTFVGETNLATLVAEVRRVLGDTADDPEYVRTVHRFGYRFVADVVETATRPGGGSRSDARMYLTTAEQHFLLPEGEVEIGRSVEVAIRIDAGSVSRRHARIVVSGGEARLEDLGSKNGTFVDGKPITSACLLKDGDEIRIGRVELTFRLSMPTKATETARSS